MKYRVCTYVYTWGTFEDIETARRVAKMVYEEENKTIMIRNAETEEIVEEIKA
jgi:hypothetical protein